MSRSDPVRVGIASIPTRRRSLVKCLESLVPQADDIHVSLNGYRAGSRTADKLPAFPNVTYHFKSTNNGGDAEKFDQADSWSGYMATCDDDLLYPPDYIDTLVAGIDRYDRKMIAGFHGGMTLGWNGSHRAASHKSIRCLGSLDEDDLLVNVIGTGAMGWHTDEVPIYRDAFPSPNMADVHMAVHARMFAIPMVALAHRSGWLTDLKAGKGIYEANMAGKGGPLDTRAQRKAALDAFNWALPPVKPRVRVTIATYGRPWILQQLLEDLSRESKFLPLTVAIVEDGTGDSGYRTCRKYAESRGWEWHTMGKHCGRTGHWELVSREMELCRDDHSDYFVFLPDDVRLVRCAIPRAISIWSRLRDPATLTLWRLKDHEGQPNWTGLVPVDRGHAWEVFHVDGIYMCQRPTLQHFGFCLTAPRTIRSTSSGVGRRMSLSLHEDGRRMYRVNTSLARPLPPTISPSLMNPHAGDREFAGQYL